MVKGFGDLGSRGSAKFGILGCSGLEGMGDSELYSLMLLSAWDCEFLLRWFRRFQFPLVLNIESKALFSRSYFSKFPLLP